MRNFKSEDLEKNVYFQNIQTLQLKAQLDDANKNKNKLILENNSLSKVVQDWKIKFDETLKM